MNRTAWKIMVCLGVVYGMAVGIVGALGGPAGTVALVGACVVGAGWAVSAILTRPSSPS
jgi:hypothetical protein